MMMFHQVAFFQLTSLQRVPKQASSATPRATSGRLYSVWQKSIPLRFFLQFSQQLLRIWKRNFTNLFSHPMQTYQYYHYSISLMYANVIRITVTSPSDLSLLKNLCTKIHSWKSHIKLAVKQLSGFHCQRNKAFKFTRIEPLDYYVWENIIVRGHSQVPFKPRISTCFKLI